MLEWTYSPGLPVLGSLLLLAVGGVAALYFPMRKRTTGWRLGVLVLLRLCLVAGILVCLLDPHLVREIRVVQPTRLLVLIDTSRSMLEQDGQSTRLERAQHWWQSQEQPDLPPELRGFDEKPHPLKSGETWAASDGAGTSLATVLKNVSAQSSDAPIGGIILVSDGRITDGESPLSAARALAAQGIRVSTLTLGQAEPKPFLRIQGISVPPAVPSEAPVKAGVAFQAVNVAGESGVLRLRSGATLLAEQEIKFTGDVQNVEMSFHLPSSPALQICEAELDLAPSRPGVRPEILPFAIRIANPKIKVLYMEGSAVSEMLYLQRALQQGSQIEVKLLHRATTPGENPDTMQTTLNRDDQTLVYDVMHPTQGYPRTMEEMLQYDVIINSDIPRQCFTEDQMKMTEQFVEEYGGGFVMVGGHMAFGHGGYNYTAIDKIIPVAMENEKGEGNRAFPMTITPEGLLHPIMGVGATPEETQRLWREKNPRLFGYDLVDRAKPGAVVLAVAPNNSNQNGPYVILAAQEVGNGRSMAYTSDTTRDWGREFETIWGKPLNPQEPISERNCDSAYYRKFWNNAIRWLSAKRLARKNVTFTVETSKRRVNAGETFAIQVHWKAAVSADANPPRPPDLVHLRIMDLAANDVVQTADSPLRPETNDYESALHLTKAGRYLIDLEGANEQTSVCAPAVITCDTVDPELADTRADPALMAELAKVSDGQVLSENSTDGLRAAAQSNSTSGHMEYRQESLWDQGWVLAVLAGILIAEWVLRRRWSLV